MNEKVIIPVKVTPNLKKVFQEKCKNNDSNVSREIRNFMHHYIAKNSDF